MIVFHTTFHLSDEVYDKGLEYLKHTYIPSATKSGKLHSPVIHKVLTNVQDSEGVSLAVQFKVSDEDILDEWMRSEGESLQNELRTKFHDEILGFSTLLEEIDF